MRLKSFATFFNSETFIEYLEKCVTVIILSQVIDKWDDIKDEQIINNKKLDIAFITHDDTAFVEISRNTESHYSKILHIYEKHYFAKIDGKQLNPVPLFFEVVFTKEPSDEVMGSIVTQVEVLMKAGSFPATVMVNEYCEVYIDTLEARLNEKQIVREKLNSTSYLKMLRLNGIEGKWFALAYLFDYKSIVNKISEEVKEHALAKLNNIWISIDVPMKLLDELDNDEDKKQDLNEFLSKFEWLQGLLIFNISIGSVSDLSFMIMCNSSHN